MKRNIIFKNMILVTAFLSILLVLVSCSSDSDSSEGKTGSGESGGEWDGQKLKFFVVGDHKMESSTDPKTGDTIPGLEEVKEKFEEEYPGAELEIIITPWEGYTEKTQALITSGGADVFQLPGIADYAAQDLLVPLEEYIEEDDFELDQYVDGQVEGWKSLGPDDDEPSIYGLPYEGDTRITVYDKEIFDQWGVEYLSDEPTLEEIAEKAEKMTGTNPETGEENYGIWYRGDFDSGFTLVNATEGLDGQWGTGYGWDEVEFEFNSSEMKEALEWLKEIKEYTPKGILSNQGNEKWLTEENNIAMELQQAPGDTLKDAVASGTEERFGVTDDFSNSEGIGGFFSGSPLSIAKDSDNKELAWEFIKFTASDFYQEFNWQENKVIPVTESSFEIEEINENPIAGPAMEALSNPWTPRYPWGSSQPRHILTNAVEEVLAGEKEVDEALEDAQEESEKWLERR